MMSIGSNTHTDQKWRQVGAIFLSEECQNFISSGATFSSKPTDRLDAQGGHRRGRYLRRGPGLPSSSVTRAATGGTPWQQELRSPGSEVFCSVRRLAGACCWPRAAAELDAQGGHWRGG